VVVVVALTTADELVDVVVSGLTAAAESVVVGPTGLTAVVDSVGGVPVEAEMVVFAVVVGATRVREAVAEGDGRWASNCGGPPDRRQRSSSHSRASGRATLWWGRTGRRRLMEVTPR
jgi:hypothetical protein